MTRDEMRAAVDAYLGDLTLYEELRTNVEMGIYCGPEYSLACFYAGEPLPPLLEDTSEWAYIPFGPFGGHGWRWNPDDVAVTSDYMLAPRNVNGDIEVPLGEYPPVPVMIPGGSFVKVSCNGEAVRYDIPDRKVLVSIPPSVQAGDVVKFTIRGGVVGDVTVDRAERD